MSGGALEHVYFRIEDVLHKIPPNTPTRVVFRKHLQAVAEALRALEWNLSGDGNPEDEEAAIRQVIGGHDILSEATHRAREALVHLQQALEQVDSK